MKKSLRGNFLFNQKADICADFHASVSCEEYEPLVGIMLNQHLHMRYFFQR